MKHAPILPPRDDLDEELSRLLMDMPPPPGIPTTDEEEDAAIAESLADVAAGRFYSGEMVGEWIATISTPDFTSFEEWIAKRDG